MHAASPAVNGQMLVEDGENILMEISRKLTMSGVRSLAFRSGWYIQVIGPCRDVAILTCHSGVGLLRMMNACLVGLLHGRVIVCKRA